MVAARAQPHHRVPLHHRHRRSRRVGTEAGPILAGAIELVSPANEDRPEHAEAFLARCATYLQQGVGVVIVDVVTSRSGSLHPPLYATGYRAVERDRDSKLDVWQEVLSVGMSLPTMPLWLPGGLCVPVELNETYERTCREQRIEPLPP